MLLRTRYNEEEPKLSLLLNKSQKHAPRIPPSSAVSRNMASSATLSHRQHSVSSTKSQERQSNVLRQGVVTPTEKLATDTANRQLRSEIPAILKKRKSIKEIIRPSDHWLDRLSRRLFPLSFGVFNVVYWSICLGKSIIYPIKICIDHYGNKKRFQYCI